MSKDTPGNKPSMETSMGTHSLTREERRQRLLESEIAKQIDHILFTEWDPIGVHWISDDCADEYQSYVPKIVRMVHDSWAPSKISDFLLTIETDMFGDSGSRSRRRCDDQGEQQQRPDHLHRHRHRDRQQHHEDDR